MIENQSNIESTTPTELPVLEKDKYPQWIIAGCFCVLTLFFYSLRGFLFHEFSHLHKEAKRVAIAEWHFEKGRFDVAIKLYGALVTQYPGYEKGKIRMAECCFRLIEFDEELYYVGLGYLAGGRYSKDQFKRIESYLPFRYREDFEQHFREEETCS